jgi:hypothetical protein
MCFLFANRTKKVQAVRVNTQGFMLSGKRPRFEQVMLPQNDQIFSLDPASLSEVMGIKIVGRPLNDVDPSKRRLINTNHYVQHLFRCCLINKVDTTAASFNQRDWDHEFGQHETPAMMGPVILARHDKQPLHILHAMAMLNFAETVMSPEFDDYQQQRTSWWVEKSHFEHQAVVVMRRLEISWKAERREFERFWHTFKQQTVHGHPELLVEEEDNAEESMQQLMKLWMVDRDELRPRPEWASVPSPYLYNKW